LPVEPLSPVGSSSNSSPEIAGSDLLVVEPLLPDELATEPADEPALLPEFLPLSPVGSELSLFVVLLPWLASK
jgi:hypothetical protein